LRPESTVTSDTDLCQTNEANGLGNTIYLHYHNHHHQFIIIIIIIIISLCFYAAAWIVPPKIFYGWMLFPTPTCQPYLCFQPINGGKAVLIIPS